MHLSSTPAVAKVLVAAGLLTGGLAAAAQAAPATYQAR